MNRSERKRQTRRYPRVGGTARVGGHHGEIALSELPSGTPLILTNSGNIAKLLSGEPSRQTIYLSISTRDR